MIDSDIHLMAVRRVIHFANIRDAARQEQVSDWLQNLDNRELIDLCSPAMEDPEKLQLKLVEWRLRL